MIEIALSLYSHEKIITALLSDLKEHVKGNQIFLLLLLLL
jgi:hypothetical protein